MRLQQVLRKRRVAVLPDLYTDTIVPMQPWAQAARGMAAIAERGGGNLPVPPIEVRPGGNAANLALALARLGVQVELVARTDEVGLMLMTRAAAGLPIGLEHVEVVPAGATTVALETPEANVMLSHAGPVADFGPDAVAPRAWEAIEAADAVAVVNWSQNRRGSQLLDAVCRRAAGFVYLDTGDPRHRPDAAALLDGAWFPALGAWGMNENEVRAFGGDGDLVETARGLATRLGTRIDLHTRQWAASVTAEATVQVPADPTPARRLTGAGDAWNAGNLAGYLAGLDAERRLELAHATATRHVAAAAPA